MGWFSSLFGHTAGNIDSLINSPFSGFEDYFTGASSARRQYRYQSALQSASQAFNAGEAEKAYQRERELAQLQNDLTKSYFDYVSAYNTPANQMARLKEAGLNPNLVYGNGAMAVQAATPVMRPPSAPQASGSGVGSASGGVPQHLGSVIGAISGLSGITRDIAVARESKAREQLLKSQKAGQDLTNVYEKAHGMFGYGRFGDIMRTVLGIKAMFPDQYNFAKKWIVDHIKGVDVSKKTVGKVLRGVFGRPPSATTVINQQFKNGQMLPAVPVDMTGK